MEEFVTRKPKNPFLHDTISYYYFHTSASDLLHKKFIYYPNFKNAFTIYKNSKVIYSENNSISTPDQNVDFSFLYSGVQKQFRTAEILAPFDKIGIVFQELGINHFIEVPLSQIANDPIDKSFDYYGEEMIRLCEAVYAEKSIDTKVELLDAFFQKKYRAFDEDRLKKSIQQILNSTQKIQVKEVAQACDVSEKTLSRIYKKHLCCTPKDYIDVVQFRKALNDYLLFKKKSSLTELAINNTYYDQAQFIKHFKKLTGVNPKRFFKDVQHLGYEDTFWTFSS